MVVEWSRREIEEGGRGQIITVSTTISTRISRGRRHRVRESRKKEDKEGKME